MREDGLGQLAIFVAEVIQPMFERGHGVVGERAHLLGPGAKIRNRDRLGIECRIAGVQRKRTVQLTGSHAQRFRKHEVHLVQIRNARFDVRLQCPFVLINARQVMESEIPTTALVSNKTLDDAERRGRAFGTHILDSAQKWRRVAESRFLP